MKLSKKDLELIKIAQATIKQSKKLKKKQIGLVGCALLTAKGNIYIGVSLDYYCGIGFCAEHSAIASMVTNGEDQIKTIVAIDFRGSLLPPCGRCREFIYQTNNKNLTTEVIIGKNQKVRLKTLLPKLWQKEFFK